MKNGHGHSSGKAMRGRHKFQQFCHQEFVPMCFRTDGAGEFSKKARPRVYLFDEDQLPRTASMCAARHPQAGNGGRGPRPDGCSRSCEPTSSGRCAYDFEMANGHFKGCQATPRRLRRRPTDTPKRPPSQGKSVIRLSHERSLSGHKSRSLG